MLHLELSHDERDEYRSALLDSHRMRVQIAIRDNDEEVIETPDRMVLEGSVTIDADSEVSRSLDLTLLDPDNKVRFNPSNPAQGVLFAGFFIAVQYGVYVDALEDWIDAPIFWGIISGYSHSGPEVHIEAQGKESLLMDPYLATEGHTLPKGLHIDEAIKRVARYAGEERFDIPNLAGKLHDDVVIRPGDELWATIARGRKSLVAQTGSKPHQIFYDGRGRLKLRRLNHNVVWRFRADETILSPVELGWDMAEARNWVRVRGTKPKGEKRAAVGQVELQPAHPMSPRAMARNDVDRAMAMFEDSDNLSTDADCRERAREVLEANAEVSVSASFDSLVVPTLEPGDMITVETGDFPVRFPLRQVTIPLTADTPMTIGATRRIPRKRSGRWMRQHRRERRRAAA